ncbi:hypothetical protein LCM23_13125 [Cytobacillus kochii]|uniref:hypothetical protein n=1 Tax=Cytobacillus kochii TaxID=859143 RepID=UPI001CD6717A|nr:hypothetical protein [Cytobacillus kochii]MCA1027037.1 hypothetical protein [Cytobacillus kochii]
MSKIIILEGARGTGKSSVSFQLRQHLPHSTLINFTGFNESGEEGLNKITTYYDSWLELFRQMKSGIKDQVIICDRFFFSERVYSALYKDYDFSKIFKIYSMLLPTLADELFIYNFTIHDEKELTKRLQRDKIPFSSIKESVEETLKQQKEYKKCFDEFFAYQDIKSFREKIAFKEISTDSESIESVLNTIKNEVK